MNSASKMGLVAPEKGAEMRLAMRSASKAEVPAGATNAAAEPSATQPAARPRRSGAVQGTNALESPESPAAEQRADERAEGRATVRGKGARVPRTRDAWFARAGVGGTRHGFKWMTTIFILDIRAPLLVRW